jgi:hypothetical protein
MSYKKKALRIASSFDEVVPWESAKQTDRAIREGIALCLGL